MKIGHDYDEIREGEHVFVLEDSYVGEEKEDRFVNQMILEDVKARKRRDSRVGGDYDNEKSTRILSKYDDPFEDDEGFYVDSATAKRTPQKPTGISLETEKVIHIQNVANEYKDIRIPKKRKKKLLIGDRDHMQQQFLKRKQTKGQGAEPYELKLTIDQALSQITPDKTLEKQSLLPEGQEYNDTELFLESLQAQEPVAATENTQIPGESQTGKWVTKDLHMSRGLGECVRILRNRGELSKIEYFGRFKDKEGPRTAEIIHRDSKGRILTKKQAFREQCYQTHSQKPKLNKLNKLQKQAEARRTAMTIDPARGDTTGKNASYIMSKKQEPFVKIADLK